MAELVVVTADPAKAVPVGGSGKGSRAKSTLAGRYEALAEFLEGEGGTTAPADRAISYESLRAALGDEFVSRFRMMANGAKKVSGDCLGNSAHGLCLRRAVDGQEVVFVAEGAARVAKALGVLRSLPAGTGQKKALAAVRSALGLAKEEVGHGE